MENNISLSYKSICLYQSDIECFKDYNELNDMSISFYYEYLSNSLKLSPEIVLMDPSAVISIIHFDDDLSELKDYFMNLTDKKYKFLTVNDNTDKFKAGGGTHWALLVYQQSDKTFYYFDSMLRYISNTDILVERISLMVNDSGTKVVQPGIKKYQGNTYDCGMFVLKFAEYLLKFINKGNILSNELDFDKDIFNNVSQDKMKSYRREILKIIKNLQDKRES
jgi:sentrin-specific protease 8